MKKVMIVGVVLVLLAVSFLYATRRIAAHKQQVAEMRKAKAAETALQNLDQTLARAGVSRERPEDRPSALAQQEATDSMAKKLAAQSGPERDGTAADNFWGFYLVNTRSRLDYCAAKGVDIGPFVRAFADFHVQEVAIATDIYRASPQRPPVDKIYDMIKPDLEATVAQDQADMATSLNMTRKEACEFLNKNTDAMLAEVNLRKMQPAVYAALHAAKR
jgi:hypothetical protein